MHQLWSPRFNSIVAFCLVVVAVSVVFSNEPVENNGTENLAEIQAQVVSVVARNMESCVAISDGEGFGSGVIVSADGLILTAGHVVCNGKQTFELFFPSGRTARATLVGYNLDVDSAMLRLEGNQQWPFVKIASDKIPEPGTWVVGLGHSGGYELGRKPPVRTGRVLEQRDHMLVTDSVLIGGDSGGPLFNLDGELIGIHSSIGDVISENRHVSIVTFRNDWSRLIAGNRWGSLPELGEPEPAPKQAPKKSNANNGSGSSQPTGGSKLGISARDSDASVVISEVQAGSPAARVGLKTGDLILSLNGTAVTSASELSQRINNLASGSSMRIEIKRNSTVLQLVVILDRL